jgi:hypothetical protein
MVPFKPTLLKIKQDAAAFNRTAAGRRQEKQLKLDGKREFPLLLDLHCSVLPSWAAAAALA